MQLAKGVVHLGVNVSNNAMESAEVSSIRDDSETESLVTELSSVDGKGMVL